MSEFIYHCPHCGQKYECDESWINAKIECQSCGQKSVVRMPGKAAKKLRWLIPAIAIAVIFAGMFLYTTLLNDQKSDIGLPYHKLEDKISRDYACFYKLWKNKDAKTNQAETLFLIGKYIHESKGFQGNYPDALIYYKKAAEHGNLKAYHNMGCIYFERADYNKEDRPMAFSCFQKGVEHNIPQSYYMLAKCYLNGYGVDIDYRKCFELTKKAADMNYPDAQCFLGLLYQEGKGVVQNTEKFLIYLKKAAENNHPDAQYILGKWHEDSNKDTALNWMKRSAKNKNHDAMQWLYEFYKYKDKKEALKWLLIGAESGDVRAIYKVGDKYENGEDFEKNYDKAVEWFKRGADRLDGHCSFSLAEIYYNHYGNIKKAKKYYENALMQGYSSSLVESRLNEIKRKN